ncbi:MAG: hypothetical protein IBX70_13755 [Clostridia bacterium]|nr:hypothetical protein [Clostridia bacterium]
MKYSEIEASKLSNAGELTIDERIKVNILNFIRAIHLNRQNFIKASYESEYFGELPMTFKKNAGQVIGLITADVGGEVRRYVFTDDGYESLEDVLELLED